MKKVFATLLSGLLLMFLNYSAVLAASSDFTAFAPDTIAGYSAYLKTTPTYPNADVVFTVVKPDKTRLSLDAKTDDKGIATYELDGYHTRQAGYYYVSIWVPEYEKRTEYSMFTVYADDLSDAHSTSELNKHMVKADGSAEAFLLVKLYDKYENPLSKHLVNVVSSRSSDTVERYSKNTLTDEYGTIGFTISSNEAGLSTYTIMDISSGVSLSVRPQIFFYDENNIEASIDNEISDARFLAMGSGAQVAKFLIEDLPASIKANEAFSFTVVAADNGDNPVVDYAGTIHFSSETDANAELPLDYKFTADDLGMHAFELSLKFSTVGKQKLKVNDLQNVNTKGEIEVTVLEGTHGSAQDGDITLTSPQAGSYKDKKVLVKGKGTAGALVKIFDGTKQAGVVQADEDGNFQYELSALSDGQHVIKVVIGQKESPSVTIKIDTLPPGIDQMTVEPQQVAASGTVKVTITTDSDAQEVSVKLGTTVKKLTLKQGAEGVFEGDVAAPATAGTYKFEVTLKDALGNQQTVPDQSGITVTGGGQGVTFEVPSQITNLQSFPSDSQVLLRWNAAKDNTGISYYNVYYGTQSNSLTQKVRTSDNRTEWFVTGLKNGTTYYFMVKGVDTESHEADQPSALVTSTPYGGLGLPGNNGTYGAGQLPPGVTPTGPETLIIIAISSGLTWAYRRFRK